MTPVTDGADLADDARAFVAEHQGRFRRPVAARRMQIAVADARSLDFDEDFTGPGRVELGRFDGEGLSLLPQDGGVNVHGLVSAPRLYFRVMKLQTCFRSARRSPPRTLVVHAQNPAIDAHVAAAKAAVGGDHQVLFASLCSAAPTGPGTRAGGAGGAGRRPRGRAGRARAPPAPPARERWHAEPVKVFDNLYSSA